jgi:hypothetical protein
MQWQDAPRTLAPNEDFFKTPIFIQSFNQVSYLERLVKWILAAGYSNICIIDNHSTYAPLLQFYAEVETNSKIAVVRRNENGTRTTLWDEQFCERFAVTGPFVYTDSDIIPDECCPSDVVARLAKLLRDHSQIFKAGLGLRIDDLPASYSFRPEVINWERQFWMAPVCHGAFLAPIDTTFALYRPGSVFAIGPSLRTWQPYVARHATWYQDSQNPTEEQLYYASEVEKTSRSHWGRRQLPPWLKSEAAKRANSSVKLLHLACGEAIWPGWINLDREARRGVDIVFDLKACAEQKLPIADNSIDGFFMSCGFERIEAIMPMMQELYRVAKSAARFIVRLRQHAADTPTDCRRGRRYLPSDFIDFAQPAHAGIDSTYLGDWRLKRTKVVVDQGLVDSDWETLAPRIRADYGLVKEIVVELCAVKPLRPRQRHLLEWPVPTIDWSMFDAESDFQFGSSR